MKHHSKKEHSELIRGEMGFGLRGKEEGGLLVKQKVRQTSKRSVHFNSQNQSCCCCCSTEPRTRGGSGSKF